jgi:hypothetical protein
VPLTPLEVRHQAALELLCRGELDPYEALCLVCWPQGRLEDEQVEARTFRHASSTKSEALALYAEGLTTTEIGRRLGVPPSTVKSWLQVERRPAQRLAAVTVYRVSSEAPVGEPRGEAQLTKTPVPLAPS